MRAGIALAAIFLASCATLPDLPPEEAQQRAESCIAVIPDATLREAVGSRSEGFDFARRVSTTECALAGQRHIPGNRVTLLEDGVATHRAQLAAIEKARDSIHLDVYILRDDDLGQQYAKVLEAKARAGVKVRLIYDSFGSITTSDKFFAGLRDAGAELLEYNDVNPLKDPRLWRWNHRNHHKLLIVDGRVAFTGGINVSNEYSGGSTLRKSARKAGREGWRDTQVQVEGPAVAAFQRAFLRLWAQNKSAIEDTRPLFPELKPVGHDLVQLLTSHGADLIDVMFPILDTKPNPKKIYTTYLAAISQAHSRVWITQAYFAPDDQFIDELKAAARRGVDVRLVMPGMSDVGTSLNLQRHYYSRLLKAGVRLYEYEPAVMHAKTAVIDGVWSTVGSSNLDYRSFIHNDEANAIILGRDFASQLEKLFQADLEHSSQIVLDKWKDRGFWERTKELGAVLVKYWI
jgi:cardiolipin synthase